MRLFHRRNLVSVDDLQTIYVLMFIEIGSRRVHFSGCTAHPDNAWITQQARQVMWALDEREPAIHFLIRDNDKKFTESFDTVFRAEGIDVIPPLSRSQRKCLELISKMAVHTKMEA